MAAAAQNTYLETIWRTSLGIGVVFPLVLLGLRFRLQEPEEFKRNSMKHAKMPYWLVLKFYGWRLLTVSLIWFIYDVSFFSPCLALRTWDHRLIPNGSSSLMLLAYTHRRSWQISSLPMRP